jgi:hypothetical protein
VLVGAQYKIDMFTNEELINMCKEEVENAIRFQLNSKRFKYLIRDFSEKIDFHTKIEFDSKNFEWKENQKIEKHLDDYFSLNLYVPLSSEGVLKFINNNEIVDTIEHSFSLYVNMWFHFDSKKPCFTFDILDESKNLLKLYNERIWSIIDTEEIKDLLNEKFNNKVSAQFFTDITRLEKNRPIPFQDFDVYDDLVMCHQDIIFSL